MKSLNQLAKRAKAQHRSIEPLSQPEFRDDVYRDCLVYQFEKRKEESYREVQVPLFAEADWPDVDGGN